ncbi:hypothetical protein ABL849_00045 [Variovorax sp. 375MFSha3.1]|uniref:hypothetical protein n=1 Tax=Variovorax sp. 375MFSha3.1 TaxID=3158364 RepID=UPI003AAE63E6
MLIDIPMPAAEWAHSTQLVKPVRTAFGAPQYQFGVCKVIRGHMGDSESFFPLFDAQRHAKEFSGGQLQFGDESVVIIVKQPRHGIVSQYPGSWDYQYTVDPDRDFVGNDHVIIDVSSGGSVARIHYFMSVDKGQPSYIFKDDDSNQKITDPARCPRDYWKIRLPSDRPQGGFTAMQPERLPVAISFCISRNEISAE